VLNSIAGYCPQEIVEAAIKIIGDHGMGRVVELDHPESDISRRFVVPWEAENLPGYYANIDERLHEKPIHTWV
jgi:hypothetical protein